MSHSSAGTQRDQDSWYRCAEMAEWNLIQLQHKGHTKLLVNAQSQAQRASSVWEQKCFVLSLLVCSVFEAVTPSQHASRSGFFSRAWRSYSQSCSALLMEFPQLCCSRWDSQAPRNRFSKALALHHCCALPSWIPPRVFFSKSSAVLQAEPSWEHSTHRLWQFSFTDHWPEKKYIKSIHRRYFLIFLLEFTHWKLRSPTNFWVNAAKGPRVQFHGLQKAHSPRVHAQAKIWTRSFYCCIIISFPLWKLIFFVQ